MTDTHVHTEPTAEQADRSRRVVAVARLPRRALIGIIRNHANPNPVWYAHPLERWSRDDLVAEVLQLRGLR